jgi:hypothetical protein
MTDKRDREKLAGALRHLATGQIINREYEDRTEPRSSDGAPRSCELGVTLASVLRQFASWALIKVTEIRK